MSDFALQYLCRVLVHTHWLAITNFFPVNGISEVVDFSRHDWKYLLEICPAKKQVNIC
jgi:hypothetical protein